MCSKFHILILCGSGWFCWYPPQDCSVARREGSGLRVPWLPQERRQLSIHRTWGWGVGAGQEYSTWDAANRSIVWDAAFFHLCVSINLELHACWASLPCPDYWLQILAQLVQKSYRILLRPPSQNPSYPHCTLHSLKDTYLWSALW